MRSIVAQELVSQGQFSVHGFITMHVLRIGRRLERLRVLSDHSIRGRTPSSVDQDHILTVLHISQKRADERVHGCDDR